VLDAIKSGDSDHGIAQCSLFLPLTTTLIYSYRLRVSFPQNLSHNWGICDVMGELFFSLSANVNNLSSCYTCNRIQVTFNMAAWLLYVPRCLTLKNVILYVHRVCFCDLYILKKTAINSQSNNNVRVFRPLAQYCEKRIFASSCLSVCLSVRPFVCLSVRPSVCLSVLASLCLSAWTHCSVHALTSQ
jgi:hypothetical protein